MQNNFFSGRLTAAPTMTGAGDHAVTKFVLITNEYAGKDKTTGEAKERSVSIRFTAFRKQAEIIAQNCRKGDALQIKYRIENNRWTDNDQVEHFDYNFIVDEFEFGAPGQIKRNELDANNRPAPTPEQPRGSRAKKAA